MAYQVVSQPGNPDSGYRYNPREDIRAEEYAKRSRAAGYEWNPVERRWTRKPASAGGRVNEYTKAAMGGGGGGASFEGLLSAAGGGGAPQTGGGFMAPGGGGGGTIGGVAPVGPIDTTAADEASFARAKDVAGQTGRASLESLRGLMGETGQLGGGAETQATRDIVESAAGQVGDVNREQAIQRSERGFQTALANQQSGLTQRGQDINAQEAQARLAMAQTQLQFQQQQAQAQRSLDLLRLALSQAGTAGSAGLY